MSLKPDKKRHLITAALIYANGPVHIGHLAGCYLPADIYARFLRAMGEETLFVSGTDEHGVPITLKAKAEGISPQQVVDKYYEIIKKAFEDFGMSFDIFSRTGNPAHHETASDFFKTLHEKGIFEEKETEQFFDPEAKQFLADRYIIGTCPKCGYDKAYGDQCESCGSTLNPTDLIRPRSALSGSEPVIKKTANWFLPLDKLQPRIEKFIQSHPEWKSNVSGQCASWLNSGLQPRAMTRDLDWGVKVPLANAEGKVLYVWFDAPIGYLSMTKEWAAANGSDWQPWWKSSDTSLVHFIGKDNIVFHCIIFPAMLMAHEGFILPDNVPANEFMNLEKNKLSTSRNWAVWLHEYLEDFPGKEDVLRYVLTANAPETKDSDFTWNDFLTRNNSELVANLGNFINRTMVLTGKFYDHIVPSPDSEVRIRYSNNEEETISWSEGLAMLEQKAQAVAEAYANFNFRQALFQIMELSSLGNALLQFNEPWKKIKTNPEDPAIPAVMNLAAQLTATLGGLIAPVLPFTAHKLRMMLAQPPSLPGDLKRMLRTLSEGKSLLENGHQLNQPQLLFEKMEERDIAPQLERLNSARMEQTIESEPVPVPPLKPEIVFDDFAKPDLRVGQIVNAQKVPKADKLLELRVDIGLEERTILSGIAACFQPEEIVGQKVIVVANLAPRKMRGIESQGMILMAEDQKGSLYFVAPPDDAPNGSIVR